jgi:hypothetical protein
MRLQLDPLSPTGVSLVQQTIVKQTGGYVAKVQFLNELEDVDANPTNNQVLSYDSSSGKWIARTVSGGGGGADWGDIGGTLSDQTDLQNALNAKYDASNPSNFINSAGAPVQSVAGKTGTVSLDKNDVGLGNVDNTSDVNKPISSATQTALDAKQNTLGFTPENVANKNTNTSLGTSNTDYPSQNAVKSYVDTGLATKENTFSKGNLIQGTNVTLSGTLTNRLVGSGDVTINASGGGSGGQVDSVVAGTGIDVDATDPINPEVSLDSATISSLALADSSLQSGDNVSVLTNDAGYLTSAPVASVNTQTGAVVLDTDDITDTATNRYTNDTDISRLANTSGTNTGDQDLSGLVPTSRNVNSGTGLTGGGNLSADRTLALDTASQASLALADTSVQPGDDVSDLNNDAGYTTNTGTVTSVAVSGTDGIDVDSGSPVTGSGTIQLGVNATTLKTHLSLNNVDNTSDANKPVSTAQRNAINELPIYDWQQFEEVSGSFNIAPTSSQGIAWDGTHFYVTNNTHLYKYNSTGTLQTSRDISGDGTLSKMGGITVSGGLVYVTASNYPTTPEVGYVMTFNSSDLSYVTEYSVGVQWPGSIAEKDGDFWLVNYFGEVQQWPSNFASATNTYSLDTVSDELDGVEWIDNSLFVAYHENDTYPAVRQFHFTGTDFIPLRSILRPDGWSSQDIAWDSTNKRMYFNRRGYGAVSDAVVFTKPANIQQRLADKGGWVGFISSLSFNSYNSTTRTGVINCSGADTYLSLGARIKFSQPTDAVEKYGVVTAVSSTTFTLFMNSDYDLDNEAIRNAFYSIAKAPMGFPTDITKWSLIFTESTDRSVSATGGTWYKLNAAHQLVIPVGVWNVKAKATVYAQNGSNATAIKIHCALSTSTSSVSNEELYQVFYNFDNTSNIKRSVMPADLNANLTLSSQTTYNLICKQEANGTLDIRANVDPDTFIKAVCAYI